MSALLRPIDALVPRAARAFGGKAKNLAALARGGFPVPAAFALSSEAALEHFGRALPEDLRPSTLFASRPSEEDLAEAQRRVLEAELSEDLHEALARALLALGGRVAVRSSSTSEDQGAASAAGQHISVLDVRDPAALSVAVRQCWASALSPGVFDYARTLSLDHGAAVGVVIQAMVPATAAGVMFTVNPITGAEDELVINAALGLGSVVTEGRVTPDTYRVDKATGWVRDRVVGDKSLRVVLTDEGPVEQEVPPALARQQALDDHLLGQLVSLGRRIEGHFGGPRDVEFAAVGDSLYVLQARPVTACGRDGERPPSKKKRRFEDDPSQIVWSNMNVGEALPGVATPLTWSVLSGFSELGFRQAFAALGCSVPRDAQLVGNVRGRIYLNLSELSRIASQVPGLKPSAVLPLGGQVEPERLDVERDRASSRGFLMRLPLTAARFTRSNLGLANRVKEFEHGFRREHARIAGLDLRVLPDNSLDETLSDVHRLLNDTGALMLTCYGGLLSALLPLQAALRLLVGREEGPRVQQALLSAIEDVDSADPGRELLRVAEVLAGDAGARAALLDPQVRVLSQVPDGEGRRAVESFLSRFGHRGVREAELAEPRWREDPSLLFDTLRAHLASADPAAASGSLRGRVAARQAAAAAAMARMPAPLRPPLKALTAAVQRYIRQRERMRSHVVRVLGLFRLVALDISRRLAARERGLSADAAFFLTLPELHAVLQGRAPVVGPLINTRRQQYERDRRLPEPPDTFVGYPPPLPPASIREGALTGLAASPGQVEGPARVLRSTSEIASIRKGDILVVPCADVGWSPVFLVAGGLVTDLGGPLSHACIVAREYGLPAVVNLRGATTLLRDGARLRVDGDAGTVQVLDG